MQSSVLLNPPSSMAAPPSAPPARRASRASWYATTLVERFLLFLALVILPLDQHLPTVGGRSGVWLIFAALFAYVILFRFRLLIQVAAQPLFLGLFSLVLIGVITETMHPLSNYAFLVRLAQMILGAILVATLCRDRQAFRICVVGYLLAGMWLAFYLVASDYSELRAAEARTFDEAQNVRERIFEDKTLSGNLNTMSFYCAQAAVAGLVLTLTSLKFSRKLFFALAGLFCLVASFLPLSRSGVFSAIAGCAVLLWIHRSWNLRNLLLVLYLACGVYIFVPSVSFQRVTRISYNQYYESGKMEGRSRINAATLSNLPNVFWTGVGFGNFHTDWGREHGFGDEDGVSGTHNAFFEVTMYWGAAALIALSIAIWMAYRCLPRDARSDGLVAFLWGLFLCLLIRMVTIDNLFAKEFSLGFGLLAAGHYWIWPQTVKRRALRRPWLDRAPVPASS